jgi:hypothetical protein
LGIWNFGGTVQRRGVHVNTPEIGSREGVFCFGGILGSHAELRRELGWEFLGQLIFGVVGRGSMWGCEEGGHFVTLLCV